MIPQIKISSNYNIKRSRCELVANNESIFDNCHYTIASFVAYNAPSEDEHTDRYSTYNLCKKYHIMKFMAKCILKLVITKNAVATIVELEK